MSKVLIRKSLFFNSKGLPTVGSAKNSLTVLLPSDIFDLTSNGTLADPFTYARVYIKKAVIPNNFNNINATNNEYTWGGVSYTLQNEDPDIYEILNELSTNGIQASYDTYNSLVSITSTGTLDLTATNSCASILGFNKAVISTPAVGIYPVQVRMTNSIFIDSNLAVESSWEISPSSGDAIPSAKLLQLPINVARYSNIIYEDDVGHNSIVLGVNQKYSSLFFTLTDEIGNALQIETDWSAELVVEIVQDQNTQIIQLLQDIKTLNQDVKTFHHIDLMDKAIKDPFWSVF